jgi:hypothetical protein
MKFLKQNNKLSIVNLDRLFTRKNRIVKKHGSLLPDSIRCIISGPSDCGKTNVLLNLLFSPKGLFFENIYIFSKSLYQSKYKFLACVLENLPEIGYYPFSEHDQIPFPNDIKSDSIVIFDDVACESQSNIKNYFSMGRHKHLDVFYICQTYSYIPKQLVRDNTNFLIVFKQDDLNLSHIYKDHVTSDMSFEKFKVMCNRVWKQGKSKFIVIDKERDLNKGRYRSGFDVFIQL